jgi:PAS domain S-box-containing protein
MGECVKKKLLPSRKKISPRKSSPPKNRPQKTVVKTAVRAHLVSETEITRLRENLREAQETLDAIRTGEVDAVVVSGAKGSQIYSLTSAEQPYRIYVERMQEGAVTVSADALILYCNHKFADMVQLPLERVIGSQLTSYLDTEAWRKISSIFNDSLEDVVKHECALQRADDSTVPANLTANRLPQQDQNILCLVVTDLTQQKKHEELRLAKEVAEKASLAKDDFLAALSHELRTPLTPVLMAAVALEQNNALPEEIRQPLEMIRRNVELEARLIDDLLDLTRIAKGKLELHLKELDFHTLIQRALEICRSEFSSKMQVITLELEAAQYHVEADSTRLQQAVWNLIRNAAKFTAEKGSIVIRTRNPAAGKILLSVADNGVGFEPSSAEKLFLAFEQGSRQVTRQFGGLGLGLAITRSIVEAHAGNVHAASRGTGHGATFTIELPLHLKPAVYPPAVAAAKPRKYSKKRILLVEDHNDTRNSLEFLLKKNQHEVKSAASAKDALRLAAENEFDLVISDIGLPDQNGLKLMEQLKDQFHLKGIGLSGYGMEEDIARGRAAGFVRHLTKPVRFEQLTQAISEIE